MEGHSKWLTPVVASLLAAGLYLGARLLDPATVAVLCAAPPVGVPPLVAPTPAVPEPSELKWFHLHRPPLLVQKSE